MPAMVFTNNNETCDHSHQCQIKSKTEFLSLVSKAAANSGVCDFVPIFPVELSLNIYSKLELKDLLSSSQVSRCWNKLTFDPLLWYRFCYRAGIVNDTNPRECAGSPPGDTRLPSYKVPSTSVNKKCSSDSSPSFGSVSGSSLKVDTDWRSVYRRYLQTQCNWRNGRPSSMFTLAAHHNRVITCVVVHKDWIITGSEDVSIDVWSLSRRTRLISLFGHRGGVWSMEVVPSMSTAPMASRPYSSHPLLVSGSCDRTARVWLMDDVLQWPCTATLFGHQSTIRCIASCRLGAKPAADSCATPVGELGRPRLAVTGSRDTTLRLWDADTGRCVHVLTGHRGAVRSVQFTGGLVASASYDCTVRLWCALTGRCLHRLTGHTNRVYTLAFDGQWLASASLDTTIRVWRVADGQLQANLVGHKSLTSSMLLLGPAAAHKQQPHSLLVSSNADGTLRVWTLSTGTCLHVLAGPNKHQSAVTDVQLTGNFIISSSDDGTVKLWDRSNGSYIRDLFRLDAAGRGAVVWRLLAVGESQLICAAGSRNGLEASKVVVLQFDSPVSKLAEHNCAFPLRPTPCPRLSELLASEYSRL